MCIRDRVSVIVPDDYLGNVIGDLNSRRGQIQGQESRPGATQVDALVPLANMFGYATDLRSSTQGRGQYSMEPHSYVDVYKRQGRPGPGGGLRRAPHRQAALPAR